MDYSIKVKFSIYVHLPSMNKMFRYGYTCVILSNVGGYYFRAWVLYFSYGTCKNINIKQLYVLLACINTIYKYGHGWGI